MNSLAPNPPTKPAAVHHFDRELCNLSALALGRVADDLRTLIDKRNRELQRSSASSEGVAGRSDLSDTC